MAAKTVVVKVHLMNNSSKAFALEPSATAVKLRELVIERLGLKEHNCFGLFLEGEDHVRCLEGHEKPFELMAKWEKRKDDSFNYRFVFKKKIFLKDDDKELEDPVAMDLVYQQAVHDITSSVYPSSTLDATRLAGYQMQVTYGDHNPAIHIAGFLTKSAQNNLKSFVPVDLYKSKKSDWEAAILKEHMQHVGLAQDEAKLRYLTIVKAYVLYGTTFFPPCRSIGNRNVGKVIIGVNNEGIRLLKPKTKEQISEHLFTEICSWASSSGTFAFEFGSQTESTKYSFETKQGSIIASTIQTYIDILVQMLKQGEDDDDLDSATYTSEVSQAL
mmetsp:Transcript_43348/g.60848  ORF Transcript_43348/g.60848 Transcript_43348/m.60848 type:complete len:329 (-) Transcript_43348:271-1257(-)|eukprot:CAMPEP_0201488114 /NCGR_PEP_ID=MMETSP0151_2-20130828/17034_1 /ASSEMBLY_ACC=CAM_ASM_000257 /TAXON_ID=200890 /ORGANISM="Paramoeba atlantica, Strain 621/1 / CCAP 1560/9" /LENGTH=328 /DNA_ID=CAMNT_0047873345 /DNA_START=66 /DNA_END=1052 /DNA_ORIENTATION=+